jgi:hypothetical protein
MTEALAETVNAHLHHLDAAVESTMRHHRTGDETVVLSETAVAVRTAKALEMLTGVDWDAHLEARATGVEPAPAPEASGFARR